MTSKILLIIIVVLISCALILAVSMLVKEFSLPVTPNTADCPE